MNLLLDIIKSVFYLLKARDRYILFFMSVISTNNFNFSFRQKEQTCEAPRKDRNSSEEKFVCLPNLAWKLKQIDSFVEIEKKDF